MFYMFLEFIKIMLTSLIATVPAALVMIVTHEVGHLICGKLTGYTFHSFTLFGRTIYQEGDRLKVKKYSIKGTGGQCLMAPPPYTVGHPYKLYHYGGVLANLLMAMMFGYFAFFQEVSIYSRIILAVFFVINLMGTVENGYPLAVGGIPNDGMNVKFASKDTNGKKSLYQQLYAAYYLSEHERFTDIPHSDIAVDPEADLTNYLTGNAKIFEALWQIEAGDVSQGISLMVQMEPYILDYPGYYKHNFINELTYNYIQYDHDSDFLKQFLEPEHQKYCQTMTMQNFDLASAAYAFSQGDKDQGRADANKAKQVMATIPQIGLKRQADDQIYRLEEKFLP